MLRWLTGMSTSSELCSTKEMIERLKDVISLRTGDKKIFDKNVAYELGVTQSNLATMIKRDTPPLEQIILFCNKNWVDPLRITIKKNC